MTPLSNQDLSDFNRQGFLLIKKVFKPDEIIRIRELLYRARERVEKKHQLDSASFKKPLYPKWMEFDELFSTPELRSVSYIVLDNRVISYAKQLIGEDLVYFGDSEFNIGTKPGGWHKDNTHRANPNSDDWRGNYPIIRFGLYLQDHKQHSGGLKVIPKSHMYVSRHHADGTWGGRLHFGAGRGMMIDSEIGDLIVWNLRTSHSGFSVRVKFAPNLSLHPLVERIVPRVLRVPEQKERIMINLVFGLPGPDLDRYNSHGRNKITRWTPNIAALAQEKRVEVLLPGNMEQVFRDPDDCALDQSK